jgi:hypothetical protein
MIEFTDKVIGTAIIKKELTEKDIENIIVTAFEGGSNYWMELGNNPEDNNKPKGEPWSTWFTKMLLEGNSVKMCDVEGTEDDSNWILTLDKVIKGYQLNCEQRPLDCDVESGDAITCDCIIQYALFDKIIFG